jgi:hypothetical protein
MAEIDLATEEQSATKVEPVDSFDTTIEQPKW